MLSFFIRGPEWAMMPVPRRDHTLLFPVRKMLIATMAAVLVAGIGRSTWFVGVFVLMVYLVFAMTLVLLPPRAS